MKYPKMNFEKTIPITDKQPLILKILFGQKKLLQNFGLLKYTKIFLEKTTPITDKQPSILKNTFRTKKTTFEYRSIFGLLKMSLSIFKVHKKIFFIQSRLYMAMQGCILMLRAGAQKCTYTWIIKSIKICCMKEPST